MKEGGNISLGVKENIELSGWKVDENGRRYRMVGNTKEYEMMVSIDGHEIPASMVNEYHERKREALSKKTAPAPIIAPSTEDKRCPFRVSKNGIKTACDKDCAFYRDGCIFTKIGIVPQTDTKGAYCPMARICTESCMMYDHGCRLISIVKQIDPYL